MMIRLQEIADSYRSDKPQVLEDEKCCPDCGSPMIKRKNNWNNGYWWGCGSFPKCRKIVRD